MNFIEVYLKENIYLKPHEKKKVKIDYKGKITVVANTCTLLKKGVIIVDDYNRYDLSKDLLYLENTTDKDITMLNGDLVGVGISIID